MAADESPWLVWQIVDSAFPTGAFAHSWGLEAAWQQGHVPDGPALRRFVAEAVRQTGSGVLPLLTAAYRRPDRLGELDVLADAFLSNVVANRASRVQGRTLVATMTRVWPSAAMISLLRQAQESFAHVGPVSGAAFRAVGVTLRTAQQAALFGTARGVLSAAVRLGIVGSYEAQRIQVDCAPLLDDELLRSGPLDETSLAQTSPVLDILHAGHDRLYSRLFQS
jgi:urease accessory protein